MRILLSLSSAFCLLTSAAPAFSQHEGHAAAMYGPYPMSREASGTSWQPDAAPHEGKHWMAGGWMGMLHGSLFAVYSDQAGDRGDSYFFPAGMFMATGVKTSGAGRLGLRAMASPDPLMGRRGYPLLLQTGETADGKTPLIDRQHPHEFIDELAVTYARDVGEEGSVFVYAGLPGEPALGPPVFMHRFSGMENPEAPLAHHWLDSTHVTMGVATLGLVRGGVKLEGSLFRGREPDEDRWGIEKAKLDSRSARLTLNPAPEWSFQASWGHLESPEKLSPDDHLERTTASAMYHRNVAGRSFQATAAWGRNAAHGEALNAYLLESAIRWDKANTAFLRAEHVEVESLFTTGPHAGEHFEVGKLSLGYARDVAARGSWALALGGLASAYAMPGPVRDAYGDFPVSFMLWARLKLG